MLDRGPFYRIPHLRAWEEMSNLLAVLCIFHPLWNEVIFSLTSLQSVNFLR